MNDLTTIALACATIPIALELHGVASRTSAPVATAALVVDVVGVALAAVFSAALLFFGAAVPPLVGWFGVAGGAGLAVASMAFPCWIANIA